MLSSGIFVKNYQTMPLEIIIPILILLILGVYLYYEYKKRQIFKDYINLTVSLDFNQTAAIKTKGHYGLLLFNIKEINKESRAFYIENLKLSTSKVHIRNYNNISTKLPLPKEGVVLSVGVRKSKSVSSRNLGKCNVTISGFLMEDQNKKSPFKAKLPVEIIPNK